MKIMKKLFIICIILIGLAGTVFAGKGSSPMDEEVRNPIITTKIIIAQ